MIIDGNEQQLSGRSDDQLESSAEWSGFSALNGSLIRGFGSGNYGR